MNKWQAIHTFWSIFNLPAYDSSSVPDSAQMPYITYEVVTDSLDNPTFMTASLWYHGTTWEHVSNKADEIAHAIVTMRKPIALDEGYLWIVKGTPFAQRMSDPDDPLIRRVVLNIQAEYLTAY